MPLSLRWRYGLAVFLGLVGSASERPARGPSDPGDAPVRLRRGRGAPLVRDASEPARGSCPLSSPSRPSLARADAFGLASLISVVEAWAACLLYRRFGSLVFTVAVFWFGMGWLIDVAVYGGIAGLPLDS